MARITASFVKNVLQQGNLTQGDPAVGDLEVRDPVRGTGGSVQRRASSGPAGRKADGKKVRGVDGLHV